MNLESIAFIPDGNRRYAKKSYINLLTSYKLGTQKAWEVIDWLHNYPKIKSGTFYTLSLENLTRNKIELNILFRIFEKELEKVKTSGVFDSREMRLKFIGRLNAFPKRLQEKIRKTEEYTADYKKKVINLAIGYNGQAEIVDAAKKIAWDFKNNKLKLNSLNPDSFKNYLYSVFPDPDLILRTSGTKRLSGFLTYQSSYSELYFLDKYWPELQETDLDNAINEYNERERKFGK